MKKLVLFALLAAAPFGLAQADQSFIAQSNTAMSITGDITIVGTLDNAQGIVFAPGAKMDLALVEARKGEWDYEVRSNGRAALANGNYLCSDDVPVKFLRFQELNDGLSMSAFAEKNQLCGTFNYSRR